MNEYADKPPSSVEVDPVLRKHAPILANLLELYAHDFSEFQILDIGADGRFGYESLPLYWSELNRHPILIRVDGKLAGLALVKRGSEISGNQTVWDMSEFFVLRGCRRRGIGMLAAQEVWSRFPGIWEVRVMQSNVLANLFWSKRSPTLLVRQANLFASRKVVGTGNFSHSNRSAALATPV
jgi:predicted acetyltransferase